MMIPEIEANLVGIAWDEALLEEQRFVPCDARCVYPRKRADHIRTYAVVGFGEASPPQDFLFPAGCGGLRRHNQPEMKDFGGSATLQTSRYNADCVSPAYDKAGKE